MDMEVRRSPTSVAQDVESGHAETRTSDAALKINVTAMASTSHLQCLLITSVAQTNTSGSD